LWKLLPDRAVSVRLCRFLRNIDRNLGFIQVRMRLEKIVDRSHKIRRFNDEQRLA
jgi:hypothetical protein